MVVRTIVDSARQFFSAAFAALYQPRDLPQYTAALLIPILGAALSFISSDCSPSAVRWRKSLRKSRWSPSAAVTAITWVILYTAMGHASFLVFITTKKRTVLSTPLLVYIVQCLLNHFYIIVLFGLQRIDLAFLMIIPLWFATGLTTLLFFDVHVIAGRLMLAVFLWVSINVYFNAFLLIHNRVYTDSETSCAAAPEKSKNT